jgi:pimeloyl-ACP methyl ester carboxylesterase
MLLNTSMVCRRSARMPKRGRVLSAMIVAAIAGISAASSTRSLALSPVAAAQADYVTIERFVRHVSTVPANEGQVVGIYLHEKLLAKVAQQIQNGATAPVVLFIEGGTVPSVPDYDLPFKDYSWMAYLARAGFDTFSMDVTGYGFSPRPEMDDPCNADPSQQAAVLVPNPLAAPCSPTYPFRLETSQSDWDEMDTVVDYIRNLRGVDRISIIGWSGGGPRGGGYASLHPEKIDKLILESPGYSPTGPSGPPAQLPAPGFPTGLQTRFALEQLRWQPNVHCAGQVDPDIRPVIWQTIMGFDSLGSAWGPQTAPEGPGVMRYPTKTSWGWNSSYAANVTAPTLITISQYDASEALRTNAKQLFSDLTAVNQKVLLDFDCASHFLPWESQHVYLMQASLDWLQRTQIDGETFGTFEVNTHGHLTAE